MTDERKDIFIDTVDMLFQQNSFNVPPEALDFFEDYKKGKTSNRKEITEKGITILKGLREVGDWITAKSLGEKIDMSGRSVSGSLRKLVEDGFVEKKASTPAVYKVSEKGITYEIPTVVEE